MVLYSFLFIFHSSIAGWWGLSVHWICQSRSIFFLLVACHSMDSYSWCQDWMNGQIIIIIACANHHCIITEIFLQNLAVTQFQCFSLKRYIANFLEDRHFGLVVVIIVVAFFFVTYHGQVTVNPLSGSPTTTPS